MAHFQNQFDNPQVRQAEYDEFGNPVVRSVDEYGNPIGQHGTAGAYPAGTGMTGGTPLNLGGHHEGGGGVLQRSGSSSSSSSEDDGQGGRRKKKGIKEKVKEKIPGVGHKQDERTQASYGTTTVGYGAGAENEQPHEKKGMMEKIKEKLPGHHHYTY